MTKEELKLREEIGRLQVLLADEVHKHHLTKAALKDMTSSYSLAENKLAEVKEIIKVLLDHSEHNEDKCTFSEYSDVIRCAEEFINEE